MRPIACARNMAVLDGVDVDVVYVRFKIAIITNGVLPKSIVQQIFCKFPQRILIESFG